MKKARSWLVKLIALVSTVTILAAACQATSIIIDVEADRIIIVADSRAEDVNSTSNTVRDDQCKIVVLGGRFAFAETGHEVAYFRFVRGGGASSRSLRPLIFRSITVDQLPKCFGVLRLRAGWVVC
jgi:hypothetical protein